MLKRVKELTDDIQVGYILSIAYGDFYSMDDVDFFSMNASFLSKQIVDAIHILENKYMHGLLIMQHR